MAATDEESKRPRPAAPNAVRELLGETCTGCENPSLLLTKFARVGKAKKGEVLDVVVKCQTKNAADVPSLEPKGAVRVWARLKSRLAVNLAGGILENAHIALHPHFGVPCLPGSAVKGIARHAAWCEWVGAERDLKVAKELAAVFGFPTGDKDGLDAQLEANGEQPHAGCVAFLPAFPKGRGKLERDVVTCHHAKYYSGKEAKAADDEGPNPQFFPAVAAGETFRFTLAPLRGCTPERLARARGWLVRALTINGAGAKTAAGYGWFEDVTEVCERESAEKEREALRREELARLIEALDAFALPEGEAAVREAIARWEANRAEAERLRADPAVVQRCVDNLNRLRKQLPQESPLDALRRRWANEKQILKDAKHFAKEPQAKQEAMVTLFLEQGTLAREVYCQIRNGLKGFPGDAQQAILAAVKARNGGKA